MENDYLLEMFLKFSKAYGIRAYFDDFEKYTEEFSNWVHNKSKASENYIQLFKYMTRNDAYPGFIAEFGKGKYDTVTIPMYQQTSHNVVAISPFAETIKMKGIDSYRGKLVKVGSETVVKYYNSDDYCLGPNCHNMFNNTIDVLMTQAPFSTDEIKPILNLIGSDKTLFIGAFGSLDDQDKAECISTIENLHAQIRSDGYENIEFYGEISNGSYLASIKINPNQKVLKKTLYK